MTSKTKTLTDRYGERLNVLPSRAVSGHVFVRTDDATDSVIIGPFDPADLITAIREVAGMDETPKPDPAREHTADDFAKAESARYLAWRSSTPKAYPGLSDADMAEEGWRTVTPAPTTIQGCVDLMVSLAYEPEEDETIPRGTGLVEVWNNGRVFVVPEGYNCEVFYRGTGFRRLLIDPPAPVTPEWYSARIVEARALGGGHCQWASTTDGMWVSLDGSNFSVHRNYLADVKVIFPEGVEA